MAKPLVMAVDDEDINLNMIAIALEDKFDVVFAHSGEDCLEQLKDIQPVLILLDMVMPGLSGQEVCRKLQSQPATQSIPVIFVTANEETQSRIQAYSNGATGYVVKPIDSDSLLGKVESALH